MKSFAEILIEKIKSSSEIGARNTPEVDGNSPMHLAFLMGQIPKWSNPSNTNNNHSINEYKKFSFSQTKVSSEKKANPKNNSFHINEETLSKKSSSQNPHSENPQTKNHTLTENQIHAKEFFLKNGAVLKPDFTKEELRSHFRVLALKTHPDRQPEAQKEKATRSFQELKVAYESLKTVFSEA